MSRPLGRISLRVESSAELNTMSTGASPNTDGYVWLTSSRIAGLKVGGSTTGRRNSEKPSDTLTEFGTEKLPICLDGSVAPRLAVSSER